MLVVAALQQQVWFYTSRDLKQWNKVSSFGPAGSAKGNIWEVPELFELPVDGDPSRTRWVLIVSVNRGALWGGSGVQYFTGQFDGERFVADASGLPADASGPDAAVWADHGRDFYAPITFANLPDGRCVWMGWINNWEYAGEVPTDPWRGQMSVPRELDLVSTRHGLRLRQRPARELREWAEQAALVFDGQGTSQELAARLTDARLGGQALHISLRVPLKELRGEFGLRVFETSTSCVTLGFDAGAQIFLPTAAALRAVCKRDRSGIPQPACSMTPCSHWRSGLMVACWRFTATVAAWCLPTWCLCQQLAMALAWCAVLANRNRLHCRFET